MSASAERLHLLHEHVRLSLLECKRALASGTEPNSRIIHEISRSLDTLHQGILQLEREQAQLQQKHNAGELEGGFFLLVKAPLRSLARADLPKH